MTPPPPTDDDADASKPATEEVNVANDFDPPNRLLAPDPLKANAWVAMPPTTWIFQPGELCPAPRVRLARGEAWLEMSFDALTGNVENETNSLP